MTTFNKWLFSLWIRKPEFDDAPESIRVYSNHMVRFSKRVNFDIGCNMDFTTYPVDLQKCFVTFESFGYTIKVCSYSSLPFKTILRRNCCYSGGRGKGRWDLWWSPTRSCCLTTTTAFVW